MTTAYHEGDRERSTALSAVLTFVAVSMFLVSPRVVLATTLRFMAPSAQIAAADMIFLGTVTNASVRSSPRSTPYTFVTFSVIDVLKGDGSQSEVTLRMLGGTNEDRTLAVAGMPEFAAGITYLVFVAGNGTEACPVVGWQSGVMRLAHDARSGDAVLLDALERNVTGFDAAEWTTSGADAASSGPSTIVSYAPAPKWVEDRGGATTTQPPPSLLRRDRGTSTAAGVVFDAIRRVVMEQAARPDGTPRAVARQGDITILRDEPPVPAVLPEGGAQ